MAKNNHTCLYNVVLPQLRNDLKMEDLSIFTKISVTQHIRYIEEQLNTLQKAIKVVNELHDKFCTNEVYTCGIDKVNPLHINHDVPENANTKEDVQEDVQEAVQEAVQEEAIKGLPNNILDVQQQREEEEEEEGVQCEEGDDEYDVTQKKRVGRPPKQTGIISKKRKTKK